MPVRLAPAVATVRLRVRAAIADLEPGDLFLVACSGGPDSLALAAAAAFEAGKRVVRAGAVVVDHGLQAGSADVAERVAGTLSCLGLQPVHTVRARLDMVGAGPEAAARAARYAALTKLADRTGARAVLLGHTLDDQAETVLLGLARGSGARSLAGMRPVSGIYRRPLLGVTRAETEAACQAAGLQPWHDPHNLDPRFARTRARRAVLPVLESELGPGVTAALARTAELLRGDADALDGWAESALGECSKRDGVATGALLDLPGAVRRRVLRMAALRAGCPATDLTAGHVAALERLVTQWHGQRGVDLPGPVQARRRRGDIVFAPVPVAG